MFIENWLSTLYSPLKIDFVRRGSYSRCICKKSTNLQKIRERKFLVSTVWLPVLSKAALAGHILISTDLDVHIVVFTSSRIDWEFI